MRNNWIIITQAIIMLSAHHVVAESMYRKLTPTHKPELTDENIPSSKRAPTGRSLLCTGPMANFEKCETKMIKRIEEEIQKWQAPPVDETPSPTSSSQASSNTVTCNQLDNLDGIKKFNYFILRLTTLPNEAVDYVKSIYPSTWIKTAVYTTVSRLSYDIFNAVRVIRARHRLTQ